jgi:hypothetical protein
MKLMDDFKNSQYGAKEILVVGTWPLLLRTASDPQFSTSLVGAILVVLPTSYCNLNYSFVAEPARS